MMAINRVADTKTRTQLKDCVIFPLKISYFYLQYAHKYNPKLCWIFFLEHVILTKPSKMNVTINI